MLILSAQDLYAQVDSLKTKKQKSIRNLDPTRASMLAASFPGLGQIYNRKIWKVPFVYAGFGAAGYSIIYNSSQHSKYLNGYRDLTDAIPETISYNFREYGPSSGEFDRALEDPSFDPQTEEWVKTQLINGVDYYRRFRDLSYVGVAVWYLITILDANVDAHMVDYDVSEDLSIAIRPVLVPVVYGYTVGVGVNIIF